MHLALGIPGGTGTNRRPEYDRSARHDHAGRRTDHLTGEDRNRRECIGPTCFTSPAGLDR